MSEFQASFVIFQLAIIMILLVLVIASLTDRD